MLVCLRQAFENYKTKPPTNEREEFEFFQANAPRMFQAVQVMRDFISSLMV
jgi:hypothetical protein